MPLLQREGRAIQNVYDRKTALDALNSAAYDVIFAGQSQNGFDGLTFLPQLRTLQPKARVIVTGDPEPARVIRALRARAYSYFHTPLPPGPITDMVQQALESNSWQDDLRVLSAAPNWITVDIRGKLEAADRTVQFFREVLAALPNQTREDIAASFRELILNAVEHGTHGDPGKRVRVTMQRTPRLVIGQIADPGKGFSLDAVPHAAISNPADSPIQHIELREETGQRPGGFGILMTRNMVDGLVYNERGNAVLFVKNL